MNALDKAIGILGSQSALAEAIGVKQAYIWNWKNRGRKRVPAEHCAAIEDVTGGKVKRSDLRPDINWGRV